MPNSYKTSKEAREDLLEKSRQWRAAFNKLAESKTMGAMANTVVGVVDSLVAQQSFTHETMETQEDKIRALDKGIELNHRMCNQLSNEKTEDTERILELEKQTKMVQLESTANSKKNKATLNMVHQIQLERTQNVIIIRGAKPLKKEETYDDIEKAAYKVLHQLNLREPVRVNYVRRLPRTKGERPGEPLSMRVELGCLGDKIRIFTAVEQMIRRREDFDFSINNEIPRYAMGTYKYLCKVATEVRHQNANLKTRVGIMRGETWPIITVRARNEKEFKKIDEKMYERARAEIARRAKVFNERKKKEREDRLLAEEPMDTNAAGKISAKNIY